MILQSLGNTLWILLFFPLFLLCACRLFPGFIRLFGHQRSTPGLSVDPSGGGLGSLDAASTTLAATVGTGNIIGTAQAIAMGGPGAVFWMWAAALLGCCVKSAEIWFGQRNNRGAIGTINFALGPVFSRLYAFLAVLYTLFVGNMAQMNTVVSSLAFRRAYGPCFRFGLSILLLIFLVLALCRGISFLGRLCSCVVPVMTFLYLLSSFTVFLGNREAIPACFRLILVSALQPCALLGACGGITVKNALLWGFRRGVFSNEAGLGTAGTVHSLVCCDHPERHALWGIWEVGVDTLLLCTISALTLLCSGTAIPYGSLPGAELWFRAFSSVAVSLPVLPVFRLCLLFFALSTVLGSYVPGCLCARHTGIGERHFRLLYLFCAVLGCFLSTDRIWLASDLINVLMAVPNLLSMILLAPDFAAGCEQSKNNPEKLESALARGQRKV